MGFFYTLFCIAAVIIIWLIASYFFFTAVHSSIPIVKYEITGNKDGKPIVFIHGWPDFPSGWNKQIENLKDKYLCINIELPNYDKENIQNPWGYEIDEVVTGIANQIQFVLQSKYKQWQKEGVTIIIHDWGSTIGQRLMQQYPHLVSRSVIVDIGDAAPLRNRKQIMGFLSYQLFNVACFLLPRFIGDFLMRNYVYMMDKRLTKIPACKVERETNTKILHAGMNYLYFYLYKTVFVAALTGRLKELKLPVPSVPTCFICGKWELGPWHTKKWKKTLNDRKDCRYKRYDDSKHWVMHDQCDRFNKDVRKFLKDTDSKITK